MEDFIYAIFIGLAISLCVAVGINLNNQASAKTACLKAGYPNYKVTLGGDSYCLKRVNQTDIVVPLEEVTK